LNCHAFLKIYGSAANSFINIAYLGGMQYRRLSVGMFGRTGAGSGAGRHSD
jgi:hypothetical protein